MMNVEYFMRPTIFTLSYYKKEVDKNTGFIKIRFEPTNEIVAEIFPKAKKYILNKVNRVTYKTYYRFKKYFEKKGYEQI